MEEIYPDNVGDGVTYWRPTPRQEFALLREEFEILFGGSRGGGKTQCGIVWLMEYIDNPMFRALVIRRNAEDLADWLDRAATMYRMSGGVVSGKPATIKFPSGAIIRTGHLKDEQAYQKYQGHEYQKLLIEELTQISDERRYLQLLASCRSTVPGLKPQVFLTTNPMGPGHQWVKARFVDPSPPDVPFDVGGQTRIYIPATLDDNPYLADNDPGYALQLDNLKKTDEQLWRAWRHGDWDVFAGMFFSGFRRSLHVVKRFVPKKDLIHIGGVDWGIVAPFVYLQAVVQEVVMTSGVKFNRTWIYKETSGREKTPSDWAVEIVTMRDFPLMRYIMCDPSMFNRPSDMGQSIAQQMKEASDRKLFGKLREASNNHKSGWSRLKQWLSEAPDGIPYLLISEDCTDLISQLGSAVYEEKNPEDIDDTPTGNHHWDSLFALSYLLSGIKWVDAMFHSGLSPELIDNLGIKRAPPTPGIVKKAFEQ